MILRLGFYPENKLLVILLFCTYRGQAENDEIKQHVQKTPSIIGADNLSLLVLYGSDTGVAEGIARELADTTSLEGVQTEVVALNDRIGSLPKEGAVLIVTSSYNGKPPSNAGQFVQWLEELKPDELKGFNTQFWLWRS